jgi:hypothetical protein
MDQWSFWTGFFAGMIVWMILGWITGCVSAGYWTLWSFTNENSNDECLLLVPNKSDFCPSNCWLGFDKSYRDDSGNCPLDSIPSVSGNAVKKSMLSLLKKP